MNRYEFLKKVAAEIPVVECDSHVSYYQNGVLKTYGYPSRLGLHKHLEEFFKENGIVTNATVSGRRLKVVIYLGEENQLVSEIDLIDTSWAKDLASQISLFERHLLMKMCGLVPNQEDTQEGFTTKETDEATWNSIVVGIMDGTMDLEEAKTKYKLNDLQIKQLELLKEKTNDNSTE